MRDEVAEGGPRRKFHIDMDQAMVSPQLGKGSDFGG